MPFDCLSFGSIDFRIFEAAIVPDDPIASQGFSMFFSRLGESAGESEGLQNALGLRLAEADHRAIGAIKRAQSSLQPADFQRLPIAQPCLLGGIELGAR